MMIVTQTAAPHPHRDNLFGVCAALGEDLGFNPLWLRIVLAAGMMFNAEAVLIAYAAAGLLVLASRVLVRRPRSRAATPAPVAVSPAEPVDMIEPLPLAA